jgi:hypothetical protein
VEMATRQLRIGRSVLYDLVNRYRRRPQTSSLLPWKRGRDGKLNFLEPGREQLLNACIEEFYLTPERPSLAALVQEVRRRFSEFQFPAPNYRTVRRRVEALDLRLVLRKREGAKTRTRDARAGRHLFTTGRVANGPRANRSHGGGCDRRRSRASTPDRPSMVDRRSRRCHSHGGRITVSTQAASHRTRLFLAAPRRRRELRFS